MKIKVSNLVYVKHISNSSNLAQMLLEKNYRFSILVFQDNTSKNQDFFMTFCSTHVQFQDFSELFRTSGNPVTYLLIEM